MEESDISSADITDETSTLPYEASQCERDEREISDVDITEGTSSLPNETSLDERGEKDKKEVETVNVTEDTEAGVEVLNPVENTKKENLVKTEQIPEKISISDNFLKEEENILLIEDQTVDHLSDGFLHKIQPEIDSFSCSFQELTRNQRVLMETVQQENAKLSENKDMKDLADMVADAKLYYQKLVNIKKDMTQLHEKTTKIKKRALKLQGQKMKENLIKEQQRDHDLEQERKLIAKPARRSDVL